MSGIKFSNTTPAAPGGMALVTFQADGNGNISAAYTPGSGGGGSFGGVNEQTVGYTIVAGDAGKIVVMKGTSLTATLPATPPSATFAVFVANIDPGLTNLTLSRNARNIDDVASDLIIPPYQGVLVTTDGTNWFTTRGIGSVTHITAALTAGQLLVGNGAQDIKPGNLTGDVTTSGSTATTLAASGAAAGSYTNADITVDTKGRVTAVGNGYAADTGAVNAFVVALSPAVVLTAGSFVVFKAANANTGPCTLNVNGTGVISLVKFGSTALVSGDILAGEIVCAVYDGTNWQLTSAPVVAGSSPVGTTVSTGNVAFTALQVQNFSLTMAKTFASWKVTEATGKPFWLRLYSTSAARTADATRPPTVPLALGTQHGCILDLYIDQSVAVTPFLLIPTVVGSNNDSTQGSTIYASIQNLTNGSATINVTISFVQLES